MNWGQEWRWEPFLKTMREEWGRGKGVCLCVCLSVSLCGCVCSVKLCGIDDLDDDSFVVAVVVVLVHRTGGGKAERESLWMLFLSVLASVCLFEFFFFFNWRNQLSSATKKPNWPIELKVSFEGIGRSWVELPSYLYVQISTLFLLFFASAFLALCVSFSFVGVFVGQR